MEQNLDEFKKHINILNKEFSFYEDYEKGVIIPFNTVHLLVRLEKLELDKNQYESAKFQKQIDDLDYSIVNVKRPVPKNEITGKDEDKTTIVSKEVACRQVWNVSNSLGAKKSFVKKDEAIAYAKNINDEVKKILIKV